MAGPTPVSALIHAATMVTAGVYMVARCNVFFRAVADALVVVAVVGGFTALFAATSASRRTTSRRSWRTRRSRSSATCSWRAACGAFTAGIFHVMTHAFFKACLFLGAGSVIHALGGEQDMRKMGGLARKIPKTYWTFLIATLAIAGIPPLAGFFSKDEILGKVFAAGGDLDGFGGVYLVLWVLGLADGGHDGLLHVPRRLHDLHGEFRGDARSRRHHIHESPATMTMPLMVLAVGSIVAGFVGIGRRFVRPRRQPLRALPGPDLACRSTVRARAGARHRVGADRSLSVAVASTGILLARWFYCGARGVPTPARLAERFPALYRAVANKYYVDEVYEAIVVAGTVKPGAGCSASSTRASSTVRQRDAPPHGGHLVRLGSSTSTSWTGWSTASGGHAPGGAFRVLRRVQTGRRAELRAGHGVGVVLMVVAALWLGR